MSARKSIVILAGLMVWTLSGAQTGSVVNTILSGLDPGKFSASLESNNIGYFNDAGLGVAAPEDRFGSNSYLKMDYVKGRISAGMQIEGYMPALYGFEIGQQRDARKIFLASKYVRWDGDMFTFHVGDIYDQMGNGLIFRTYEDRNLGFNNSLEGFMASMNINNWFTVKGMMGRPRLYTSYADSWVRGATASVSLNEIFGWRGILLNIEGNFLNRYESLDKEGVLDLVALGVESPNLNSCSAALNFSWKGLSLKAEYASKGKDLYSVSAQSAHRGAAIYSEATYGTGRFSASAHFRILDHMGTLSTLYGNGTGNSLSYLPALTRQYHYMLANLNPYQVNTRGECAMQLDLFYMLRKSRSQYWIFRANGSSATTIDGQQTDDGSRRLLWMDINADAECHWNRQVKTTFLYSRQSWSPSHGFMDGTYTSNIFVADAQYKIDKRNSVRAEVQYLYSKDYERDWIAGLAEYSFAPQWSVYATEMYNLGETKKHYYTAGVSWSKGKTRIQLGYGRNRAGYVCSGGVCRYSPAYTGVNLLVTSVF
ncbi:MAG: DUF6029 family protein [Candidatus Cryptobacteroides sp.]